MLARKRSPLILRRGEFEVALEPKQKGKRDMASEAATEPSAEEGSISCATTAAELLAWLDRANFTGLVLGCIEAKFCNKICVGKFGFDTAENERHGIGGCHRAL